jgi:hypothetical protein
LGHQIAGKAGCIFEPSKSPLDPQVQSGSISRSVLDHAAGNFHNRSKNISDRSKNISDRNERTKPVFMKRYETFATARQRTKTRSGDKRAKSQPATSLSERRTVATRTGKCVSSRALFAISCGLNIGII